MRQDHAYLYRLRDWFRQKSKPQETAAETLRDDYFRHRLRTAALALCRTESRAHQIASASGTSSRPRV
jgi:hypothetical protein